MTVGRRPGVALLDTAALERSAVVANNAMNRERQLAGVNSYARELGFNPVEVLTDRLAGAAASAGWLDLCCGTGRALIQATGQLRRVALTERTTLVGVDLVDAFDPAPTPPANLRLVCASVATWAPDRPFDLITCLHGLHYVGTSSPCWPAPPTGLRPRAGSWPTWTCPASGSPTGAPPGDASPRCCATPASPTTPAAAGSAAPAAARCASRTVSLAPTTALAPTTPANRRSTPTTPRSADRLAVRRPGRQQRLPARPLAAVGTWIVAGYLGRKLPQHWQDNRSTACRGRLRPGAAPGAALLAA
ncbi:hypothetical protein [Micromonospora sp. L31]|uniref:class I SAM-dependent methyltransferase n=1 Tax=Micromonospora sp. L31 TaxID=3452213 RepID=UPI003F8A4870